MARIAAIDTDNDSDRPVTRSASRKAAAAPSGASTRTGKASTGGTKEPVAPTQNKTTKDTRSDSDKPRNAPDVAHMPKAKTATAKDTDADAPPQEVWNEHDPFVTFLLVTLASWQLALQTDMLTPLFNSAPLTRWSRWVGVFGVVAFVSLLPGPNALRLLLSLAAISCDLSVTHGRVVGSKLGQLLGPEWAPAAASATLGFGALVMAARLSIGGRKPGAALLHSFLLTATLWTGELMSRKFLQHRSCGVCRWMSADSEKYTFILAFLFTLAAIVSHTPRDAMGRDRSGVFLSRAMIALVTLPALAVTTYKLTQRPSAPFTTPEVEVLMSQKSNSGQIVVGQAKTDTGYEYRYLRADHSILGGQWVINVTDGKGGQKQEISDSIFAAFPHQEVLLLAERGDAAAPLRPAKSETALIIGLGVGIAATQLMQRGLFVDVVEYDQVVYDAAVKYFSYGRKRPRSRSIDDGAAYIRSAATAKRSIDNEDLKWNYVIQDCFTAGSLPVELFTVEFWNNVQDSMTRDGVVVMNFAGSMDSKASRKVIRTLFHSFPQCRAFSDIELQDRHKPCNMVFVCTHAYDPLLTFRAPTAEDIGNSYLRHSVYNTFLKREVPVDTILLPGDWDDKSLLLHSGDKLEYWNDAKDVWRQIEKIMSPSMWMAY